MSQLLSDLAYQRIDRELAKFPADQRQSAIMAALAIAQAETGWVSPEVIEDIARVIGVAPIAVQEVATFYNMFDTKPVGNYRLHQSALCAARRRDGCRTGAEEARCGLQGNHARWPVYRG